MADVRQRLKELLDGMGESSRFATAGSLPMVLPGLEVKGIGPVGCPVSATDAKRLITKATQAPYGRGEATIVDTNIRRVWQIDPSKFSLRNKGWILLVTAIVDALKKEFGITRKVNAELYKLLIYEKGSFFAPHRDSEKTPSMFATLVVCLPSRHDGGTLVVRHDGRTQRIDFGGKKAEFETQYAAFYADCEHEITPVKSGYRIALAYNLAIAGKKQPPAPRNSSALERTAELLKELFADAALNKIAVPLKHQYTEIGLDELKGTDRARSDILLRGAELLDYQCFFALLTHHLSGEADYATLGYDPWASRRSYHWSYDDEEDNEDGDGELDAGVEIAEIYDEEMILDHWLDAKGRRQPFGTVHLNETEILSGQGRKDWPFEQRVTEATGNEGVSVDRWYRRGVIVIWPRNRYFQVLAGEGQASALPALERMAARARKPEALAACRTFADAIIRNWRPRQMIRDAKVSLPTRMLEILNRIGTEDLVQGFLLEVLPKDFDGSEGDPLVRLCQRFGWESFGDTLRKFLSQQKPEDYRARLGSIVAICEHLCCHPPALTKERREICTILAEDLAQLIERWDKKSPNPRRSDDWDWECDD
ncbi:MAG: 2OG-Fe(II) oxygenase [Gemmataceae bacterium]